MASEQIKAEARSVRKALKPLFGTVKFTVQSTETCHDTGSPNLLRVLEIRWVDGPSVPAVEKAGKKVTSIHLSLQRRHSDLLLKKAAKQAQKNYGLVGFQMEHWVEEHSCFFNTLVGQTARKMNC